MRKQKLFSEHPQQRIAPKPLQREGQIRIIGGKWRGRKLVVPTVASLRPTPDRVRETLFNWLAPDIVGAHCCDLFCGSGALGFEAASRGAASVSLVDNSKNVGHQIKKNLQILQTNNIFFQQQDVLSFLTQKAQFFDIVFLDPPFKQNRVEPSIKLLEQNNWLSKKACIYIETESSNQSLAVPPYWSLFREKINGQVCSRLYHRNFSNLPG